MSPSAGFVFPGVLADRFADSLGRQTYRGDKAASLANATALPLPPASRPNTLTTDYEMTPIDEKLAPILAVVLKRNPGEPEFHQDRVPSSLLEFVPCSLMTYCPPLEND